jgi:hypothetical protein
MTRTLAIAIVASACGAPPSAAPPVRVPVTSPPAAPVATVSPPKPESARCLASPIAPGMTWTEHVNAHFVGTDTCHGREEKKRDDVDEIDLAKRVVDLDSIEVTASQPRAHWTVVKRLTIIEAKGDDGTFAWPEGLRENPLALKAFPEPKKGAPQPEAAAHFQRMFSEQRESAEGSSAKATYLGPRDHALGKVDVYRVQLSIDLFDGGMGYRLLTHRETSGEVFVLAGTTAVIEAHLSGKETAEEGSVVVQPVSMKRCRTGKTSLDLTTRCDATP